ncbi:MAG: hypothetical protein RIC19_01220 [Phaeodactylibacter sp.]|uniref:hypothetical protein n=1 Tax=Phaeodactylibacter sp. TaxID=1940289 RepID=UPI0032EE68E4
MVQIANPIYDVVFKYLMRDEKLARLLLSAIIGEEVVSLALRPTEHHFPLGENLMVLRMDFSARIRYPNGDEKLVILELQKAKLATDIMRFRRYLGEQYKNKNNVVQESAEEYASRKALPILSIYFLGHKLEHTTAPVIRVNRQYIDAATGEVLEGKETFIESLTHDSIIIQIPLLKGHRRNDLEQLLSIFDQSSITKDRHLLNIEESGLPKRYRPLLRRLQQAIAEPVVREVMEAEDELIDEFKDYQRKIADKELELTRIEIEVSQKEEVISQREHELQQAWHQMGRAVQSLHQAGHTTDQIATMMDLPLEKVKQLLS